MTVWLFTFINYYLSQTNSLNVFLQLTSWNHQGRFTTSVHWIGIASCYYCYSKSPQELSIPNNCLEAYAYFCYVTVPKPQDCVLLGHTFLMIMLTIKGHTVQFTNFSYLARYARFTSNGQSADCPTPVRHLSADCPRTGPSSVHIWRTECRRAPAII
jgi:hypothetical protein